MASIQQLPSEILVHIFSFYALSEPQESVLKVLGKVCSTWKNASSNHRLWKIFDGSICFGDFMGMCKNGVLLNTKEVTFSLFKNPEKADFQRIYSNLLQVRRLNFSQLREWSDNILSQIEGHCLNLSEVVLSNEHTLRSKTIVYHKFENFFTIRGSKITCFDFSHSWISGVNKLLLLISKTCPNLEELIAHNLSFSSSQVVFPIGEFQHGCARLKVLQLGDPFKYNLKTSSTSQGFLELEVFTHFSTHDYTFTDNCLKKLLFQSNKLRILDLRGCIMLTPCAFFFLPSKNLERLYISGTKILASKQLSEILTNWRHSLVELDVSKMDSEDINQIFLELVSWNRMPCIENLIISGTKLESGTLKEIILNCPKLRILHLEGCRRIGRGLMRTYHNRKDIDHLFDILDNQSMKFPLTSDGLKTVGGPF